MLKQCRTCGELKDKESGFYVTNRPGRKSVYNLDCRVCVQEKRQAEPDYQRRNREYQWKIKGIAITWDQYHGMLEEQNGKCFICGLPERQAGKLLAVDHDHKTMKIRRLLCTVCNTKLGWYEQYKEIIDEYLKEGE